MMVCCENSFSNLLARAYLRAEVVELAGQRPEVPVRHVGPEAALAVGAVG